MRMGRQELTAAQVLNTYSRAELSRILRTYGEERYADRIARRIVAERDASPSSPRADSYSCSMTRFRQRPAKPVAIRRSGRFRLSGLRSTQSSNPSNPCCQMQSRRSLHGRIAVLAYHSLEDRLVKQILGLAAQDRAPRDLPRGPGKPPGGAAAVDSRSDAAES